MAGALPDAELPVEEHDLEESGFDGQALGMPEVSDPLNPYRDLLAQPQHTSYQLSNLMNIQRYSMLGGSYAGLDENTLIGAQKRYIQQHLLQRGMLNAYQGQLSSQVLANMSILLRQQQLLAMQTGKWPQPQRAMAVTDSGSRHQLTVNQTHGAKASAPISANSDEHQSKAKLPETKEFCPKVLNPGKDPLAGEKMKREMGSITKPNQIAGLNCQDRNTSSPTLGEMASQKTLPNVNTHIKQEEGVNSRSEPESDNFSQTTLVKKEKTKNVHILSPNKVFQERTYKLLVKGVFETMLCPREMLGTHGSSLVPLEFLEKSSKKRKKGQRSEPDDETWDPSQYLRRGRLNNRARKRAKKIEPTQNLRDKALGGTRKWVACDKCEKWRQIPDYISDFELRGIWYCSMNRWNPHKAFCEAPEDTEDELFPAPSPVHARSQTIASQHGSWTAVSKEKGGWTTVSAPISDTKSHAGMEQSRLMATLSQQMQAQQRVQFYAHLHQFLLWLKHPNPSVALEKWVDVQGVKVDLYVLYLSCLRLGGYKECSSNGNRGFQTIALEAGLQHSADGEEPKDAIAKVYIDVLLRYEEQFSPAKRVQ